MPMNTTLVTRSASCPPSLRLPPSPPWAITWLASTICSTISAVDMLRVSPAWPVAQNGQFIPQPAWLDTHSVTRPGYRISTDSTSAPSNSRHRNLTVSPRSVSMRRTSVSSGGKNASAIASRLSLGRSVICSGSVV